MENANPLESGDNRKTDEQKPKKPYTKPTFRYERVFETGALSCGKVHPNDFNCHTSRKVS
jgi:hypothetical protein